jgi:hypothetical protein
MLCRRGIRFVHALVVSASFVGCSSSSATQSSGCASDADCQTDGAHLVCLTDHTCGVNATTKCTSDEQCTKAFGGQPYVCASNSQCVQACTLDGGSCISHPDASIADAPQE